MSAVLLQARGLARRFADQAVLRGIDLSVPAGQIQVVLGPTGCGKTTLLRCLAGLDTEHAGTIERRATIAYQPQSHGLLPWLDLRANVLLPQTLAGQRGDPQAAEAALARVGLAGCGGYQPAACSGGMRQRAMVARLLLSTAPLCLLDEPFSACDEGTRHQLQALLLDQVRQRACGVVLVTHDLEEALSCADRILILGAGRIASSHAISDPQPRDRRSRTFSDALHDLRLAIDQAASPQCADAGAVPHDL